MAQQLNQFAQTAERGQIALLNADSFILSAVVDASIPAQSTLKTGDLVKIVGTSKGVPHVIPTTAAADTPFGFVVFNAVKNDGFKAGDRVEIMFTGGWMYMIASAAITAGSQVIYTPASGQVTAAVGSPSSNGAIVGVALDAASAAGDLIRVYVKTI